jgi:hypothetical protein
VSELGETFREWKKYKQAKKADNFLSSIELLKKNGIQFTQLSSTHLRIGDYDFWPSTGKWIHRPTKRHSRGVFRLLKGLGKPDPAKLPSLKEKDETR